MSELSNLQAPEGANRKRRRVGRGHGSGHGKTAGTGHGGQKSRQGQGKPRRGFEGGQMPLARRLPKRGFFSRNRVEYAVINVAALNGLEAGSAVDIEVLRANGLIKKKKSLRLLKILGEGELAVRLTIQAHKFSKSAVVKIEAAGGTAEVLDAG